MIEAQKEKEISECAGTDDQGDVDFALKKAVSGSSVDDFELTSEKNSLKRLHEEAEIDSKLEEKPPRPEAIIAPKKSMRNLVEESIGDSIATELSEETSEAPTYEEFL